MNNQSFELSVPMPQTYSCLSRTDIKIPLTTFISHNKVKTLGELYLLLFLIFNSLASPDPLCFKEKTLYVSVPDRRKISTPHTHTCSHAINTSQLSLT